MPRLLIRVMLLVYFAMPIGAGYLMVRTFTQIRDDVAPIYQSANTTITNATTALEQDLRDLSSNFAPLTSAVNTIRSGLQTVVNYIKGTIFTMIDVINTINVACSVSNAACIPKSFNLTVPPIVSLAFINNISTRVTQISTQVNNVVTTTTTAVNAYLTMLTVALIVFAVWMFLTYVLFIAVIFRTVWRF